MWFSLAERDLCVLVDNKLNVSEQCIIAATKADWILGCTCRGATSKDRNVKLLLYQAFVRLVWEYCVHFWSPGFKKDAD